MEVTINNSDQICLVSLDGKLDSNTSADAEAKIMEAIGDNEVKMVINFEKLEYISSAGLRILLTITKKLKATGGGLRLCSLNDMAREVFEISGFDTILDVYENESAALKDF